MTRSETFIRVLISDHRGQRRKDRFRAIKPTENCGVIDGAADHKRGTLIHLKCIELGSSRPNLFNRCRIVEEAFEFCSFDTAGCGCNIERDLVAQNESTLS